MKTTTKEKKDKQKLRRCRPEFLKFKQVTGRLSKFNKSIKNILKFKTNKP